MAAGPNVSGGAEMGGGDAAGASASSAMGTAGGSARTQIPLGQLGRIEAAMGPPMIKSEAGSLTGWVYVDVVGSDIGSYVESAKAAVASNLKLKPGYYLKWTGQYEFLERIRARMVIVVPLTLLIIFIILYLNFPWSDAGAAGDDLRAAGGARLRLAHVGDAVQHLDRRLGRDDRAPRRGDRDDVDDGGVSR